MIWRSYSSCNATGETSTWHNRVVACVQGRISSTRRAVTAVLVASVNLTTPTDATCSETTHYPDGRTCYAAQLDLEGHRRVGTHHAPSSHQRHRTCTSSPPVPPLDKHPISSYRTNNTRCNTATSVADVRILHQSRALITFSVSTATTESISNNKDYQDYIA